MARGPGTRSQIVAWLKVLLPLLAIALLSTLFLVARELDPTVNLPVSRVEDLADRSSQTVTGAAFSGTTESGAQLDLSADTARPDPEDGDRLLARAVYGALTQEDGSRVDLAAPSAEIVSKTDRARLTGGVTLRSSAGWVMTTDALSTSLSGTAVESDGSVEATGPGGRITAGKLVITESTDQSGSLELLFQNGVQMIYRPPGPE
ncbi:LPS export ABC transporter periplasmic protein LptC [Litorisediminicola beolgyonensis]|uniref:LPS export ABC transporter periplasmic protein LptC n=1 Tax=Litorisediminicola beolgyonensis TaxID=1173614 RepID=A0ABW3ZHS1_9RHOB